MTDSKLTPLNARRRLGGLTVEGSIKQYSTDKHAIATTADQHSMRATINGGNA